MKFKGVQRKKGLTSLQSTSWSSEDLNVNLLSIKEEKTAGTDNLATKKENLSISVALL